MKDTAGNTRRYRQSHPEATRAHTRVNNAIRSGKLQKRPCEKCGCVKVHAHHDDYAQPLVVRWLCHDCHENLHHISAEHRAARREELRKRKRPRRAVPIAVTDSAQAIRNKQRRDHAKLLRETGMEYRDIGIVLGVTKSQAFKLANEVSYH